VNATASPPAPAPESVAEQLAREGFIDIALVAERAGVRRATVVSWIKRGVGGRRLAAVRAGRAFRTSWQAFYRFVNE
jgi:hypothetical protein